MTPDDLPPRHRRVAERLGSGLTYHEIADDLGISRRTVRHYTNEIASRLQAAEYREMKPQTAVMLWWVREGSTV